MFAMFKHLHMSMAVLTVLILIARFYFGMKSPANLQRTWLKVSGHVVDGLLVVSIIGMFWQMGVSPFSMGWTTEKLLVFIAYIVLSVFMVLALKGRMSSSLRLPCFVLALASWGWLIHLALSKQPILL